MRVEDYERKINYEQHKYQIICVKCLKVQSCKLYNNKYMIASTQITSTEIFAFIAVQVFKLFSREFCL